MILVEAEASIEAYLIKRNIMQTDRQAKNTVGIKKNFYQINL